MTFIGIPPMNCRRTSALHISDSPTIIKKAIGNNKISMDKSSHPFLNKYHYLQSMTELHALTNHELI